MFRGREIRLFTLSMSVILIMGSLFCFIIDTAAGIIAFVALGLMLVTALIFTGWRYRRLNELSGYLERIASGEYTLDIRDNTEGELSILKSEIYKVTITLREQAQLLKKDKLFLAGAVSDISHQLKTPLTSMSVMTDLLKEKDLPADKRKEFTQNIRIELERLQWLVSSLLKLSKIDAGAIEFKKEKVNIRALIKRAVSHLLIPMDIKGQTLRIEGDDGVNFIGDFNWSSEAITNIVKNCIEHTPNGGEIIIDFKDTPIYTLINISDNGIGIYKEDLPYVFERFYKGKNADRDSIGIGLAMSKTILQHQGGTIKVISEEGKGTRFILKLYKSVV
ncbi:MAG: HAMP domain-containing histidine kinase [Clostridiales bacterium]|nr:HAMP domain-containing histidine kinase [Clostridiales bacterium]